VRAAGIQPSHIDSHHHVHAHPYLFLCLKDVQRRANIGRVRVSKTINGPRFPGDHSHRSLGEAGLRTLQSASNLALRTIPPAKTTDSILSLLEFHEMHRSGTFLRPPWTTSRRNWTLELMVHPGHAAYADENVVLESGWLDQLDHERISYAQL
jgi:predicted glycoside hydrolase/deacetylase ChbG (UPF0249 family)